MKPIEMTPRENPTILEINEKELLEGYKEIDCIHFMPEFLEKVYDGPNAAVLKIANKRLIQFKASREKYKYIGTHIYKEPGNDNYIEYYYNNNNEIVVYLITAPKKYYPSLQMICVYKSEGKNNVN